MVQQRGFELNSLDRGSVVPVRTDRASDAIDSERPFAPRWSLQVGTSYDGHAVNGAIWIGRGSTERGSDGETRPTQAVSDSAAEGQGCRLPTGLVCGSEGFHGSK